MPPDWRQLLRWLKPGRPAAESVDKAVPGVGSSDSTAMSPGRALTTDDRPAASRAGASEIACAHKSPGTVTRASRQVSPDAGARPPVNRNGIPVLRPADDLERLFLDKEEPGPEEDPTGADQPRAPEIPPGGKKRAIRPFQAAPRDKPRTNRHGLPLLSDQDDLQHCFRTTAASDTPLEDGFPGRFDRPDDCHRRDKNGIPLLDHCHDLGRLLEASLDECDAADGDLRNAWERSIAHDARTLIKKKTGGYFPTRQLTLKERMKRYPQPQRQLDLHGLTAIQAEQHTDTYIHTAHADGLFTLRIIVGKGMHSEFGAVLPDVVEDRLSRLKRDGLVMAYRWDKGVKRKSGAVIVYLETPF